MIFECRSYDKNGKLLKVHSVEEMTARFKDVILPVVEGRNKSLIEGFEQPEIDEYPFYLHGNREQINSRP